MKTIDKILDIIEKVCQYVGALLLVGMLFSLSVQVISRYVFNTGFAWTEESARYMMVMMVFVGAVACTKQGIHVAVDAIEEMFPKTVPVLKTIQLVLMLVYCGVVFKYGIEIQSTAAMQTSPNMKIPMNYIYIVFPIAMVFIALYALRRLVAVFRKEKYGEVLSEVEEAIKAVEEDTK